MGKTLWTSITGEERTPFDDLEIDPNKAMSDEEFKESMKRLGPPKILSYWEENKRPVLLPNDIYYS